MSNSIWDVIGEIGFELHPDRVNVVAAKISDLNSVNDFEEARSSFGPGAEQSVIDRLGKAWDDMPSLTPLELAAALRGASGTVALIEKREIVDMVWTGPKTGMVASRHTEQVLLEVISSATEQLFLVSFVAYNIDSIIKALQNAVGQNVVISILLESSVVHGGKISTDSILMIQKLLPTAKIYAWNPKSKNDGASKGAVHAKCAVADGKLAFVTSANLTSAAMERNLELGVLVRGGKLPDELHRHLDALVATGIVEKV